MTGEFELSWLEEHAEHRAVLTLDGGSVGFQLLCREARCPLRTPQQLSTPTAVAAAADGHSVW